MTDKRKNRIAYINEYKRNNVRRIGFEMPNSEFEIFKHHIDTTGEKMNTFIKRAIRTQIELDKT